MIHALHDALVTAKAPSRLLDCELHEVVTGQLDMQPISWLQGTPEYQCTRATAREHGDMLVDLGSERKRIRVPEYTFNFDAAIQLLPLADHNVSIAWQSDLMREKMQTNLLNFKWVVLMMKEGGEDMYSCLHNLSPAYAACLLAVKYRMSK